MLPVSVATVLGMIIIHQGQTPLLYDGIIGGPISLVIREGRIRLMADGEAVEAAPETVLTCEAGIRYTGEGLSDTVCLLRVASGG
jgi:hypothetical protein